MAKLQQYLVEKFGLLILFMLKGFYFLLKCLFHDF